MGKVKSAILTALLVAAVVILSLFATISCPFNEVERYNSFITAINLGGDLTGEAYSMLYPEGVISESEYNLLAKGDKEEAEAKYERHGGLYVEKDKLSEDAAFKASVTKDAEILSARFGEKGYSAYSVSVMDDYAIRVSVPTNFNYAEFTGRDSSSAENKKSLIGTTVNYLTKSGELDLRDGKDENAKSLIPIKDKFGDYFKSVAYTAMGGNHYVRFFLTDSGYEKLNLMLSSGSSETKGYFFIGETCMELELAFGESLADNTLNFSVGENYAHDFSIVFNSVVTGNILANDYNDNGSDTQIVTLTPSFGEYAFVYLFVILLLVLIGAVVASIIKYKKLGLVNGLMSLIYACIMITAMMLTGVQLTVAGAFIVILGLALLTFTNFRVFEAVRKETQLGRTLQASVKTGYKKTLTTVLDLHVIIVVISLMLALICKGELAACGLILLIASLASYVLYWFTRFMWYVISSPVKDKFKFCGFKREAFDDDED